MRHFLLVYDRSRAALLEKRAFDDRDAAFHARFEAERAHRSDPSIEVVVLSADSEEALLRTHARYFQTIAEMAGVALDAIREGRGVA
jgi:hypothetical protein